MPKTDREKSFLEGLSQLAINGAGFAVVRNDYDPDRERYEGFTGFVPEGLEVRFLGQYPEVTVFPMAEFLVYDPSKVDVFVRRFEGNDETEAVDWAHANKSKGYSGEIRPFRGHFTVWGQRPAFVSTETATQA